jgi:hypothetical protein
MNNELVKCTGIIIWSNYCWLMHLHSHNIMDHLINSGNNNCSSSLPSFHFPLITNAVTSHIHFFTPCSDIDYSQDNFCVKVDESGSVLGGLQ